MLRSGTFFAYLAAGSLALAACSSSASPAPVKPSASAVGVPAPTLEPSRPRLSPPTALASPSASARSVLSCAQEALTGLSETARASQLFDVGVGVGVDPIAAGAPLARSGVGGLFLRGRSKAGLALAPAVASLQQAASASRQVPLHISADEEGGLVQSVSGPGIPAWPAAREQATWNKEDLGAASARWAAALHTLGITLNLGPVADVVSAADQASNPPIGVPGRGYGFTPVDVARNVNIVTATLQGAAVGATAKHFPGLGRVTTNTDTATTTVDAATTPDDINLQPFGAAIQAGTTAIMMSSANYPRLDATNPAMWSREIIGGLLRGRLGFAGLVISDDLSDAKAVAAVPVGARAVRFIAAGGDMVLIVDSRNLGPMRSALLAEAAKSPGFAQRVDEAALHVLESKLSLGVLACNAK